MLAEHAKYARKTGLSRAAGDGYLYARNPTFRAVRDAVSKLGYSFTRIDFCNYKTFHLIALPKILARRRFPYFDTVAPLKEVERMCPLGFGTDMPLRPQSNFVMHESCHALVDAFLPKLSRKADPRDTVLRAHLAESLANTLDLFGARHIDGEVHRFLFNLNSYHQIGDDNASLPILQRAIRASSPALALEVLFYSYLYSNFLVKEIEPEHFYDLVPYLRDPEVVERLSKKNRAALIALFRVGVSLSVAFRLETATLYFRLVHGLDASIFDLTNFDFMDHLTARPKWRSRLHELFDQIVPRTTARKRGRPQ